MAILEIKKCPDPVLRKKAEAVNNIDKDIFTLIDDMLETMYDASGIGLAANQVGFLKRVIVIDVEYKSSRYENPIVLLNPVIISSKGEMVSEEGCLSIPEIFGDVPRYREVEVCGLDKRGDKVIIKADGMLAKALQHEIDHIDGFLFWDRTGKVKRDMLKRKYKKLQR